MDTSVINDFVSYLSLQSKKKILRALENYKFCL